MKHIFTLSGALCLFAMGAIAQNVPTTSNFRDYVSSRPIEAKQKKSTASNKSMALNSRLKSYRYDNYDNNDWVFSDSTYYEYTGTRGGDYFTDFGTDFDTENGYIYDSGNWENSSLGEKTFDASNRMTSYTTSFWDGTAWEGYQRQYFTYDGNGRLATQTNQSWDYDSLDFIPTNKHLYTYDSNGNVLIDEEQEWSTFTNAWLQYRRTTKTYTSSGKALTELREIAAGGYFPEGRTTWVYGTNGNLDTINVEEYNSLTSLWEPYQRTFYTYNPSGKVLTATDERYYNSTWNNDHRYTYTYNGQGFQISEIFENAIGGVYVNDTKVELTVDANGRTTESISYDWDGSNWQNDTKSTYEYDGNGNEIRNAYDDWDNGAWTNRFLEYSSYNQYNQIVSDTIFRDFFNGILEEDSREYYFYEEYEDGTNGISQIPAIASSVQPNPFTVNVAIQVTVTESGNHTFEVYNMAGQRVHSQSMYWANGAQSVVLDGQNLPKGAYIYKIIGSGGVASGKLMKQ